MKALEKEAQALLHDQRSKIRSMRGCQTLMGERPLPLAAVFSVEGETLTHAEKSLFSASQPFGIILFGRNCKSPAQLEKLTDELRTCVGWDCPIMIDQEGGRVARLRQPHWDAYQPARFYGEQIEADTGFHVLDHELKFYGQCKECAEASMRKENT